MPEPNNATKSSLEFMDIALKDLHARYMANKQIILKIQRLWIPCHNYDQLWLFWKTFNIALR